MIRGCAFAATRGVYDALGGAEFRQGQFPDLLERNGRGFAQEMAVHPDGKVNLEKVRYTTCPVGNQDWMLQAIVDHSGHQPGSGHRPRRGHAVQGCADFLLAVSGVSTRPRAPKRRVVPEFRALRPERLPARGALLFQPGAELRSDPDSRLFVRARRAARRGIPLFDGELEGSNRREFPAERCARTRATGPTCTSPTSPI